jgi:hypothetical protein
MRRLAVCCAAVAILACSKAEQQQQQPAASISLADVAGRWAVKTMAQGSDSVLVSYELVAGADTSGWSLNFPNRQPIPMHVLAVAGDSIVTHAGPYESVLRPGVQVTVHSVLRMHDGMLMGATVARYTPAGADSVVNLRMEGARVP